MEVGGGEGCFLPVSMYGKVCMGEGAVYVYGSVAQVESSC